MHCSQSVYRFCSRDANAWKSLIRKYYGAQTENKCVFEDLTDTWFLDTGFRWKGCVFEIAVPRAPWPTNKEPVTCLRALDAAQVVDDLISERQGTYAWQDKIYKPFSNTADVRTVLHGLANKSSITRWSYSPKRDSAFLVLGTSYLGLVVTSRDCYEVEFPCIDVDEGFRTGSETEVFPEWHTDFRAWKRRFTSDPQRHWNSPIIRSRF